eukprot:1189678-Lingulodinium_polyedra.AAC.1
MVVVFSTANQRWRGSRVPGAPEATLRREALRAQGKERQERRALFRVARQKLVRERRQLGSSAAQHMR